MGYDVRMAIVETTSSTFGLVGAASPRPDTSVLIVAVVEIYYGLTEGSAGKPAANKQETARIPGRALYTADNRTQALRTPEADPTPSRDRKAVPGPWSLQVDAEKCLIRARDLDEARCRLALDFRSLAKNLVWVMLRRQLAVGSDDSGPICGDPEPEDPQEVSGLALITRVKRRRDPRTVGFAWPRIFRVVDVIEPVDLAQPGQGIRLKAEGKAEIQQR